ncbi:MAG: hypothetical protein KAJ49_03450, partial [Arcobacteraceae bacterium]|nr:hypothetical protein [Arcobacteraceae bacterium]
GTISIHPYDDRDDYIVTLLDANVSGQYNLVSANGTVRKAFFNREDAEAYVPMKFNNVYGYDWDNVKKDGRYSVSGNYVDFNQNEDRFQLNATENNNSKSRAEIRTDLNNGNQALGTVVRLLDTGTYAGAQFRLVTNKENITIGATTASSVGLNPDITYSTAIIKVFGKVIKAQIELQEEGSDTVSRVFDENITDYDPSLSPHLGALYKLIIKLENPNTIKFIVLNAEDNSTVGIKVAEIPSDSSFSSFDSVKLRASVDDIGDTGGMRSAKFNVSNVFIPDVSSGLASKAIGQKAWDVYLASNKNNTGAEGWVIDEYSFNANGNDVNYTEVDGYYSGDSREINILGTYNANGDDLYVELMGEGSWTYTFTEDNVTYLKGTVTSDDGTESAIVFKNIVDAKAFADNNGSFTTLAVNPNDLVGSWDIYRDANGDGNLSSRFGCAVIGSDYSEAVYVDPLYEAYPNMVVNNTWEMSEDNRTMTIFVPVMDFTTGNPTGVENNQTAVFHSISEDGNESIVTCDFKGDWFSVKQQPTVIIDKELRRIVRVDSCTGSSGGAVPI